MTRKAVGTENSAETLCCSMILIMKLKIENVFIFLTRAALHYLKYCPGSGVRSGLPSYITTVAPNNRGP